MGKGYVVKLDTLEWEGLMAILGDELVRQEREGYSHYEDQIQMVLAKLLALTPKGRDLTDHQIRLPKRIQLALVKVIADPEVLDKAVRGLRELQQENTRLQKQLHPKRKPKAKAISVKARHLLPIAEPTAAELTRATAAEHVKLSPSAGRRRGGLLRAAQVAEAKGDKEKAAQLRKRADEMWAAAAAVASQGRTPTAVS